MDYCNGTTHFWSDDSYDRGSYPCPGPDKCADAARKQREYEAPMPEDRHISSDSRVSIKVSIPVTVGGFTGQREQWEEGERDYTVSTEGGRLVLTASDPIGRTIKFNKADLDAALRALNITSGPVMR